MALASVRSCLPEPIWWGDCHRIWGLQIGRWGVHVQGDPLRRVHGEPHGEQGAAAAQVLLLIGTGAVGSADKKLSFSCKPPQNKVQMVNGSLILTEWLELFFAMISQ